MDTLVYLTEDVCARAMDPVLWRGNVYLFGKPEHEWYVTAAEVDARPADFRKRHVHTFTRRCEYYDIYGTPDESMDTSQRPAWTAETLLRSCQHVAGAQRLLQTMLDCMRREST